MRETGEMNVSPLMAVKNSIEIEDMIKKGARNMIRFFMAGSGVGLAIIVAAEGIQHVVRKKGG